MAAPLFEHPFDISPFPAVAREVVAELDRFAAGHEPDDDQTLLMAGMG